MLISYKEGYRGHTDTRAAVASVSTNGVLIGFLPELVPQGQARIILSPTKVRQFTVTVSKEAQPLALLR